MKGKRILAALVCMAMIMTSGSFTTPVFAQEVQDQSVLTVEAGEQIVPSDQEQPEVTVDIEEADPADEDAPIPAEPESEPVQDETDAPADGGNAEEMQEIPIDADELLTEEEQTDADEPEEPEEPEEVDLEEERLGIRPDEPSDLFDVSGGELVWAEGEPVSIDEDILLPNGVVSIPEGIFNTGVGRNVKHLYFSDNMLEEIASNAFKSSYIEDVALSGVAITIGESAFEGSSLKSINLANVTAIADSAFFGCSDLMEIKLTNAITIGDSAFKNCSKLNKIAWGIQVEEIGNEAFRGCAIKTLPLSELYSLLGDYSDPANIVSPLGRHVFADNTELTDVTLPCTLPEIPEGTFSGCSKLVTFNMDKAKTDANLTSSIGKEAFKNCVALKKIEIGYSVTSIGIKAFDGCTVLNDIMIYQPTGEVNIEVDAFPIRTPGQATIYGYEGKVKEYVTNNNRGYKYKFLGTEYTVGRWGNGMGRIIPNVEKAAAGTEIFLTVTPEKDYTFARIRVKYTPEGESEAYMDLDNGKLELIECSPAKQVYRYYMPECDTSIVASPVKAADVVKNDLTWIFDPSDYGSTGDTNIRFPEAGLDTTIKVKDAVTGDDIGPWNFTMETSDPRVATIDQFGRIVGLKKGTANISLTAFGNKSKRITIRVDISTSIVIDTLQFDEYFENAFIDEDAHVRKPNRELSPGDVDYDPFADKRYYIVEYSLEDIAEKDHSFNPVLEAFQPSEDPEDERESRLVVSEWTTSDKNVVAVKNANSFTNDNQITVKKGTFGEIFIGVKVENDDSSDVETGFIVRIVDFTPRLRNPGVELNAHIPGGTPLTTQNVYGYEILSVSSKVCTKTVKNGVPRYIDSTLPATGFVASYDKKSGSILLSANATTLNIREGEKKSFNNIYIVGKLYRGDDKSKYWDFHLLIPEVTVRNEKLKCSLTYTGRINLLYNDAYENSADNYVDVYHNVKGTSSYFIEKISDIELVSAANYKKKGSEKPDKLDYNFKVVKLLDDGGVVPRQTGFRVKVNPAIVLDKDFMKIGGAIVSSGYVKIRFKGSDEDVFAPITIPCGYTMPRYVLSPAKVVTNTLFDDPYYRVQILDAANKNKGVYLYRDGNGEALVADNDLANMYPQTSRVYNKPVLDGYEEAKDAKGEVIKDESGNIVYKNYIKISANGSVKVASKDHFKLRMGEWRKPMEFDFTIQPSNKPVVARCVPAAITMNKAVVDQTGELKVAFNMTDVVVDGFSPAEYVEPTRAKDSVIESGHELESAIDFDTDKSLIIVNLSWCDSASLENGRYTFTTTPSVSFGEGSSFDLAPIKFIIAINSVNPVLSLKKGVFSLNSEYAGGGEIAKTNTAVSNLIRGVKYEFIGDPDTPLANIHCVAVPRNNYTGIWKGDTYTVDDEGQTQWTEGQWRSAFKIWIDQDEDGNNTILGVSLEPGVHRAVGTYDYNVYGLKYMVKDGSEPLENERPVRIRIVCQHAKPVSIALSGTGSYNQIISSKVHPDSNVKTDVPGYEITYKVTMRNLYGSVDNVKLAEVDDRDHEMYQKLDEESGEMKDWSPHFLPEADPEKQTITIRLNQDLIMGHDPLAEIDEDPYEGLDIEPLRNGKVHDVYLYYHIIETNSWCKDPLLMKLTPRQTLPVLQQNGVQSLIYAGNADYERVFTTQIGKTSAQTAVFCEAANTTDTLKRTDCVKIADTAPENIRNAFVVTQVQQYEIEDGEIVLDDDDNPIPIFMTDANGNFILDKAKHKIPCANVTVQLIQPSLLVGGKTYTIPIEVRYVNQAEETKGTIVNYKVIFRK